MNKKLKQIMYATKVPKSSLCTNQASWCSNIKASQCYHHEARSTCCASCHHLAQGNEGGCLGKGIAGGNLEWVLGVWQYIREVDRISCVRKERRFFISFLGYFQILLLLIIIYFQVIMSGILKFIQFIMCVFNFISL